jgi:hypothetical protein
MDESPGFEARGPVATPTFLFLTRALLSAFFVVPLTVTGSVFAIVSAIGKESLVSLLTSYFDWIDFVFASDSADAA